MSILDAANAYIKCALWASIDSNGEPLDDTYGVADVSLELWRSVERDVEAFMNANAADLEGMDAGQVGHDLFLTRNGHGVGFWSRGLGERGDRLSESARAFGESDWYAVGEKLYAQ